MSASRLFLCSGYKLKSNDKRKTGRKIIELDALGSAANVNIRLEDVARVFMKDMSARLIDLVEIASYVYCADCSTDRGSAWTDENSTEAWSRDFHFIIPVRDTEFWLQPEVKEAIERILNFLSDDNYRMDFVSLRSDRPTQSYLEFSGEEDWPFYGVDRVVMFSGGLDSLSGAASMAARGEKLVLVSHRPVASLSKRQRNLFKMLKTTFGTPMIHIPIWINKNKNLGREHTQRTRSFLFASLGTVVAESLRGNGITFFENGVVSLNLPVADEVLRARASRTTHPLALNMLSDLFSKVLGRIFNIDNPFLFHTKTDIVNEIVANNAATLIGETCSCAHVGFFKSATQWHCGVCSQCIDRRIAITAAHQEEYDPETDYVSNVFYGERKEEYPQNMAINYIRHALELHQSGEMEMSHRFSLELGRAARPFEKRREVIDKLIGVHKRHGQAVAEVIQREIKMHSVSLVLGDIEPTSMIGLIAGQQHKRSSWKRYSDRLVVQLKCGLPIAFKQTKPKTELHLQQICDAILQANNEDLVREFPFMRWSSSSTKPDWSVENLNLWIEIKYVRKRTDVRTITEDISSDITKYGDNKRRTLFIIYDPFHIVTNESEFAEPIVSRESMMVEFIR